MNRDAKLKVLREVQDIFGVTDENLANLPGVMHSLIARLSGGTVIISFAYDAADGMLKQVATSRMEQTPEAFDMAAKVAANVAQQLSGVALEVAKRGNDTT